MGFDFVSFFPRAVMQGIPLLYGSTGEILTEKSGNLNLGIPGIMYVGGICGVIGAFFYEQAVPADQMSGFLAILIPMLCSLLGSLLMGLLYCFLTVTLRANQNVTGLTMTTFGVGIGNFFGGSLIKLTGSEVPSIALSTTSAYFSKSLPFAAKCGWFGQIFLSYGFLAYLAILLALLAGWLKVRFRVHEVISTIMMNHIISNLVTLVVVDYFRNDGPTARTPNIQASARLTQLAPPSQLNTGILLAVLLCAVLYVVFQKTPFGWQLNAAGKNLTTTRYCGVNATRLILTAMLVSGGLAGLLGAERVLGGFGYMQVNFSPGYGYDGITIAVIANNNPFGCLLMSLLMGLLRAGGTQLNIMSDVPSEWVDMLSAFIFIFVVAANAVMLKLPELRARRLSRERRAG